MEPGEETSTCTIDKKLLIYKFFYLFYVGGWGAIYPYFTLFFQQLWFSASESGLLFGFFNFCRFIGAPLICAIADKTKTHRGMLMFCTLSLSGAALFLSFAPANIRPNYVLEKKNLTVRGYNTTSFNDLKRSNLSRMPVVYLSCGLLFLGIMDGPAHAIADTLTLSALQGDSSSYGYTRSFGSLGFALTAVTIGLFVAYHSPEKSNYRPCLYTSAAMYFVASIIVCRMNKHKNDTEDDYSNFWQNFKSGLSIRLIAVFNVAIICGSFKSMLNSFLFWHLQNLGGTQILFSVVELVDCFVAFVGYFISGTLITCFGHIKVICLCILTFTFRFLALAFITNPWLALPCEILKLGIPVFVATGVSYVGLSPCVPATFQGIFTGLFFGLGQTVGPVVTGFILTAIGSANTLLLASLFSIVIAVIFLGVMIFTSDLETSRTVDYEKVNIEEISDGE